MDFNKTRSSADAEKPVRCDIIRNEEKYQQVLRRHTAISYAEGGLMYQQRLTAMPLLSIIRPKISKSTRVTGSPSR